MFEVKEVEKIAKGFANHNRLKFLLALEHQPGLTLYDIADQLKADFRNVSEHSRKLVLSGLIIKRYRGQSVEHRLTQRGREVLSFCRLVK